MELLVPLGVGSYVSIVGSLRAIGLGAVPCLLLGCLIALTGEYTPQPVPIATGQPTKANLRARAELLRQHLPDDYTVVIQAPFILISQEPRAQTEARARAIGRLTRHLQRELIQTELEHMVDVWLCDDVQRYRYTIRAYLRDWPRTLHAFYSPKRRAIVVNLESGDHALTHEVVHPLLDGDFTHLPAWIDEGLASLYERTTERDGELVPTNNRRRLTRLQKAIRHEKLPPLAALTVASDSEFYRDPHAMHYIHARYLFLFLRAHGLLVPYYQALRKYLDADPTGYHTLERLAEARGIDDLQVSWEAYVLSLGLKS